MRAHRQGVIALLLMPLASAVCAQVLDEHFISATPVPLPLLKAPIAATVFNLDELDRRGINTTSELALRTPGLRAMGGGSHLQLRGIGGSLPASGGAPAVALFTDGIYLGESLQVDAANFFDLERVEILRGPAGARSGFNAMGGAVHLQSAAPTTTWQSNVLAEAGSDDYYAVQGLIRGPITDQFSMSVAGSTLEQSPWTRHANGSTAGGERDSQYLRGAFTYHWTNLWYSRLQVMRSDTVEGELESAYLVNEVAVGEQRLQYLASWYQREGLLASESIAHELRWYSDLSGRLNFENGLYWHQRDIDSIVNAESVSNEVETTAVSAWASMNAALTESAQLRGSLRYTDEDSNALVDYGDGYWDWHLGLDYEWREQIVYVTTNSGHGPAPAPGLAADQASVAAVELGHKGRYLENRLETTSALYFYDLDNYPGETGHASGAELEARWAFNAQLTVGGSWAHNNKALPAPQNQLALFTSASWRWGWAQMEAELEYLYRDAYCASESVCLRSRGQWDGSLSARYGLWQVTAYVDNIADADSTAREAGAQLPWSTPLSESEPPRALGLRLAYRL